jgi:hypothetical protein
MSERILMTNAINRIISNAGIAGVDNRTSAVVSMRAIETTGLPAVTGEVRALPARAVAAI